LNGSGDRSSRSGDSSSRSGDSSSRSVHGELLQVVDLNGCVASVLAPPSHKKRMSAVTATSAVSIGACFRFQLRKAGKIELEMASVDESVSD
jgi:hypothetical protein